VSVYIQLAVEPVPHHLVLSHRQVLLVSTLVCPTETQVRHGSMVFPASVFAVIFGNQHRQWFSRNFPVCEESCIVSCGVVRKALLIQLLTCMCP